MTFGFIKPNIDAHTLGVASISALLKESGCEVHIAPRDVSIAIEDIDNPESFNAIKKWILMNGIKVVGFSYRLDPHSALYMFSKLVSTMDNDQQIKAHNLQSLIFGGLPKSCELVKQKFGSRVQVFMGDESPVESLRICGVPEHKMPKWLLEQSAYDSDRWELARRFIDGVGVEEILPLPHFFYAGFKTPRDTVLHRVSALKKEAVNLPLLRAHVGPYSENREEALKQFGEWVKELDSAGHLDILSVGASQLTQEKFGQDWGGLQNGGGVPVNSEAEFSEIREAAGGMLVRSYSATNHVADYASMLERTLNTAWHALSFWWFNLADGRGPMSVYETLVQHVNTLNIVAANRKPFEPNIAHHFSFRGADDLSGIVATYLAIKIAKIKGVKSIILQMMLNTPKLLSGVADIAKFKALLALVDELKGDSFRVLPQPRAGLSYFSPNLKKAKIQLASVSMLMTDLLDRNSPEIVHVVSYSEAVELASPPIINRSAQITRGAIKSYLSDSDALDVFSPSAKNIVVKMSGQLYFQAKTLIAHMEKNFPNLYSAEGCYNVYKAGYFPVPQLWHCRDELKYATDWATRVVNGQMVVADQNGNPMSVAERLEIIDSNIEELRVNREFK